MSEQNLTSVANPKRIIVANFAKIKTEPRAVEEYSSELPSFEENETYIFEAPHAEKQRKKSSRDIEIQKDQLGPKENQNISLELSSKECSEITFVAEGNCLVLNSLSTADPLQNISNIEVKKELLESHVFASASKKCNESDVVFKNSSVTISTDKLTGANSDNFPKAVKNKSIEDYSINEQFRNENIELPATDDIKFSKEVIKKENSSDKVEEDIIQQQDFYKLVKNPFFRKSSSEKKCLKQRQPFKDKVDDYFENKSIKSELIHCNELNIGKPLKTSTPTEDLSSVKPVLDEETPLSAINLNELIIKSETQATPDDNLDFHANSNLSNNCLSCNSNSSLDVNLSNVDADFVEALSTRSIEDDVSNISFNSSTESLKYFSTIELSSIENDDLPVKEPTIISKHKAQEKQKPNKSRYKRRPYKSRQKGKLQNSNHAKIQEKSGIKPQSKTLKSRKYSRGDFYSFVSKKNNLKNLPKICKQTRKKAENTLKTENDFPKPFKLEPQFVQKELNIATELPKPMMVKREAEINVKNVKAFLKPEFQPYVRLRRLKSEELLVPLKKKPVRKSRQRLSFHQMSNDNRRDFLIQHAFSLNQRIKLNRLSVDNNQLYYHNNKEQPSLYTHLTTPYSLSTDTPNESLAEADSKYFSAQELYSLFHSSTPGGSSMQSGRLDSGISTSTSSMQQSHTDNNKTLLLEIAAERAFINNHLLHFGYSPMQFELFNNSNDLNIFLKYLLGSVNMN